MEIHGYIMIPIAILDFLLGIYFLTKYQRSTSIIWYSIVAFGMVGYVLSNAVTYLWPEAPVFYHLSQWYSGVVVSAAFLLFVINFPFRFREKGQFEDLLFWFPVILFLYLIYLSSDFIVGLDPSRLPWKQNYGSAAIAFPVFFVIYWIVILRQLVQKLKNSDGIHRWQLKTFLYGAVLIPLLSSTVFDVFLPLNNIVGYGWIGPEFSVIWLGATGYIMVKK